MRYWVVLAPLATALALTDIDTLEAGGAGSVVMLTINYS
jgi:hypothetical protein